MKNMSFFLTTPQMHAKTKTVTRRLGWGSLKAGDYVMACVKCQGLGKGGQIEYIWPLRVVSTRWEPLNHITAAECVLEGFPDMAPAEFVAMFCEHNRCSPETAVNRIEFEFVDIMSREVVAHMSESQAVWWHVNRNGRLAGEMRAIEARALRERLWGRIESYE